MSLNAARVELAGRLAARREEIVEALFVRVHEGVRDPLGGVDAEYVAGLRGAIGALVDHVIAGIEHEEDWGGPLPSAALVQGRRAAREQVGLNTVLRRYVAGNALLGDYVMAEADDFPSDGLRLLLGSQSALLERIIAEVSKAYAEESERARRSPERRRAELVRRLLAGEPADASELGYKFEAWHIGLIAVGPGGAKAVASLGAGLDRRVLALAHSERTVWAWLGGQRRLASAEVTRFLCAHPSPDASLALGEPAHGISGWRLTHRQAQAALSVAQRRPVPLTAYADVALLALALREPALARQLIGLYLQRLDNHEPSSEALRAALRAYFQSGRNVSAAAAKLDMDRSTLAHRLRAVEERVGYRLDTRLGELELALRLYDLLGDSDGGVDAIANDRSEEDSLAASST
jgi:hypothetical protein